MTNDHEVHVYDADGLWAFSTNNFLENIITSFIWLSVDCVPNHIQAKPPACYVTELENTKELSTGSWTVHPMKNHMIPTPYEPICIINMNFMIIRHLIHIGVIMYFRKCQSK